MRPNSRKERPKEVLELEKDVLEVRNLSQKYIFSGQKSAIGQLNAVQDAIQSKLVSLKTDYPNSDETKIFVEMESLNSSLRSTFSQVVEERQLRDKLFQVTFPNSSSNWWLKLKSFRSPHRNVQS